MAYVFQDFTIGQVLTAAQMDQVEANIRDHIHGVSGVLSALFNINAAAVDVSNTTTETSIYSFSIPANALGATGGCRLTIWGTAINNNLTNNLTLRVKLGATTIFSIGGHNNDPGILHRPFKIIVEIFNVATNSQRVHLHGVWRDFGQVNANWDEYVTAAEDTTAARVLDVTVQWATASPNNEVFKRLAALERLN